MPYCLLFCPCHLIVKVNSKTLEKFLLQNNYLVIIHICKSDGVVMIKWVEIWIYSLAFLNPFTYGHFIVLD